MIGFVFTQIPNSLLGMKQLHSDIILSWLTFLCFILWSSTVFPCLCSQILFCVPLAMSTHIAYLLARTHESPALSVQCSANPSISFNGLSLGFMPLPMISEIGYSASPFSVICLFSNKDLRLLELQLRNASRYLPLIQTLSTMRGIGLSVRQIKGQEALRDLQTLSGLRWIIWLVNVYHKFFLYHVKYLYIIIFICGHLSLFVFLMVITFSTGGLLWLFVLH